MNQPYPTAGLPVYANQLPTNPPVTQPPKLIPPQSLRQQTTPPKHATPPKHVPPQQQPANWGSTELSAYGKHMLPEVPLTTSSSFEDELHRYVVQLYRKYDTDHSGTLDLQEIHSAFNEVLAKYNVGIQLSPSETAALFYEVDRDRSNAIEAAEFELLLRNFLVNEGKRPN